MNQIQDHARGPLIRLIGARCFEANTRPLFTRITLIILNSKTKTKQKEKTKRNKTSINILHVHNHPMGLSKKLSKSDLVFKTTKRCEFSLHLGINDRTTDTSSLFFLSNHFTRYWVTPRREEVKRIENKNNTETIP